MQDKDEDKTAVEQAPAAAEASKDSSSLADLEKEIDDAVEKVHAKNEEGEPDSDEEEPSGDSEVGTSDPEGESPEAGNEDAVDEAEAQEEPEGSQGRDEKGKFTRKAAFSDALVERAVKLGLPMSEVRDFPNEKLLSATVERLESVQKNTAEAKPGDKSGKNGESKTAADPMSAIDAIPDLNPEVYEDQIVKGFKALKDLARSQAKELVELRGKGSKDFMAEQLQGVKEFTKGDQSKETAVREKFDTLKAGYKATGKDVSDVTIFAEAAQLVLGGDMKAAANKNKAEAAGRRSAQRISRSAGQRVAAKADPIAQTGDEIHQAFFS